jgi:hypothetical protein
VSTAPAQERCSVRSRPEPLAGTAPLARAWLVLEQGGPYGARVLTDSHLPEALRVALSATVSTGTTVLLARSAGSHVDTGAHERRFWFAHSSPGGVRMRSGVIADSDLLAVDLVETLAAAARGELPPWGGHATDPLLLVCTNGRRDVCCALEGRPVAAAVARTHPHQVLEVSHLGGHRFSPTAVLLPTGDVFGRLDADTAAAVLDAAASRLLGPLGLHRGRSALAAPAQTAEHAVRHAFGIDGLDSLDALRVVDGRAVPAPLHWHGEDDVALVEVRHVDGRAWRVGVRRTDLDLERPESCGKAAIAAVAWIADQPAVAASWL